MPIADAVSLLNALSGYVWPLLVIVILVLLLPQIRTVISSRDFTIKVGGNEISVQKASEELHKQVADLQQQMLAMQAGAAPPAPAPVGVVPPAPPRAHRVLWVDDSPENNAYLIATLRELGVDVELAESTRDAMHELGSGEFDVVITDLGRVERGLPRRDAGVRLIRELRKAQVETPVVVYASPEGVRERGAEAIAAGAKRATASPTELLSTLAELGVPVATAAR